MSTLPAEVLVPASRRTHGLVWLQVAIIATLVFAIYVIRIDDLTVRGEESRRGTTAMEMMDTGDWIVPRQQQDPFFASARPPLQMWLMAGLGHLRGQLDVIAVRLPSILAILLISLLVFGYCRSFLRPVAAFGAGVAYATLAQVMELGRLGETDALFTLFVSGSLLFWHWGFTRRWNPFATWGLAWTCVALATLTKGPQAPVYFVSAVGAYLLVTRQWRFAVSWAHAASIVLFLAVWGSWQIPYYREMGIEGVRHIYTGDVSLYLRDWKPSSVIKHFSTYPLQIVACLLPWSVFLFEFARRDVRKGIDRLRPQILFLVLSIAVAFPTVWFAPGAKSRFFMPLYPCFAALVGIAIDQCLHPEARLNWRRVLRGFAIAFVVIGGLVLLASFFRPETPWFGQPATVAVVVFLSTGLLAGTAWWAGRGQSTIHAHAGILSIATFAGLIYTSLAVDYLVSQSVDIAGAVAELKRKLPADVELVSYGKTDHVFAFHYRTPIEMLPLPTPGEAHDGVTYFSSVTVPSFEYEELDRIVCERMRYDSPDRFVIVGRRVQ